MLYRSAKHSPEIAKSGYILHRKKETMGRKHSFVLQIPGHQKILCQQEKQEQESTFSISQISRVKPCPKLCHGEKPMEQREERLSLLRLSRVVTEEDKVKLQNLYQPLVLDARCLLRAIDVVPNSCRKRRRLPCHTTPLPSKKSF